MTNIFRHVKTGAVCAATLALGVMASTASAAPISGQSDVTDNGGGSFTFTFDLLTADIDGNSDGLSFTNGSGLSFVATGTGLDSAGATESRTVRQDYPAHGGLGILGAPNGDNLGVGEMLTLAFNQAVTILGFTLNDGHQDAAHGMFTWSTPLGGGAAGASDWDGSGTDHHKQGSLGLSDSRFADVNWIEFGSTGFTGYLESITVAVNTNPQPGGVIPLPAGGVLLLSGLGLLGAGAARRRKKA